MTEEMPAFRDALKANRRGHLECFGVEPSDTDLDAVVAAGGAWNVTSGVGGGGGS